MSEHSASYVVRHSSEHFTYVLNHFILIPTLGCSIIIPIYRCKTKAPEIRKTSKVPDETLVEIQTGWPQVPVLIPNTRLHFICRLKIFRPPPHTNKMMPVKKYRV